MMKTCFKCKSEKPKSEFSKHPRMADGHIGKCKKCESIYNSELRSKNLTNPQWLTRERERCRIKQENYRKSGKAKITSLEVKRSWAIRNKHKRRAQSVAARAIKSGKIKPVKNCQQCGSDKNIEKHHPDYSNPLLIEWLCSGCHGKTRRKS